MAANHLKRKTRTYRSLHVLNKSLDTAARQCWTLERAGLMPIVQMRVFHDLVRELQSQISHSVLDKMSGVEERDMFRFGRTRSNWEHELNPTRPAFNAELEQ